MAWRSKLMRVTRSLVSTNCSPRWLPLLFASALLASPARAQGPTLDASSARALVLVEVSRPTNAPAGAPAATGEISAQLVPYSEAEGKLVHNFWNVIEYDATSKWPDTGPAWLAFVVRPGTLVVRDLYAQLHWGVCYDGGSRSFDVSAGQVKVLGRLDPSDDYAKMADLPQSVLVSRYGGSNLGGRIAFGARLKLIEPEADPQIILDAVEYIREHLPRVSVAPTSLSSRPATFSTGSDAFRIAPDCGGLHSTPTRGPNTPKPAISP